MITQRSITSKDTCISTISKVTIQLPGRGDPKQYEGGREAMDVCREYGVSKTTCSTGEKKLDFTRSKHWLA
ncbi:hypothetical protein GCM10007423_58210 [Dyadobacter endophyticus]|uniref:Uncharacterized protein n=1 Tax=Dyadobacter endophyticus TaxID=1749036 RepID=A0ABQ1Z8A2_9BACT|nr:hypothetical protein GCM10007423_58210 [Dyadobacter endophyticus]